MSEKSKAVYVNNSDEMFVTGVLYGMKFAIDMVMDERIKCDKDNGIGSLINGTIESCWRKIYRVFDLVREKKMVPNFEHMLSGWREDKRNIESKKAQEKLLAEMWRTFSENK